MRKITYCTPQLLITERKRYEIVYSSGTRRKKLDFGQRLPPGSRWVSQAPLTGLSVVLQELAHHSCFARDLRIPRIFSSDVGGLVG